VRQSLAAPHCPTFYDKPHDMASCPELLMKHSLKTGSIGGASYEAITSGWCRQYSARRQPLLREMKINILAAELSEQSEARGYIYSLKVWARDYEGWQARRTKPHGKGVFKLLGPLAALSGSRQQTKPAGLSLHLSDLMAGRRAVVLRTSQKSIAFVTGSADRSCLERMFISSSGQDAMSCGLSLECRAMGCRRLWRTARGCCGRAQPS